MLNRNRQDNTIHPFRTNQGYIMLLIFLFSKIIKTNETEVDSKSMNEEFYCSKIELVDNNDKSLFSNPEISSVPDICISNKLTKLTLLEISKLKKITFFNNIIIGNSDLFEKQNFPLMLYFKGINYKTQFKDNFLIYKDKKCFKIIKNKEKDKLLISFCYNYRNLDENSKEIETVLEYPHDNNKLFFESDPELNYLSILENFITSN